MASRDKELVIVAGELKTPPMSELVRRQVGSLLRQLQKGETLEMPISRAMPSVGARCAELRVADSDTAWRVLYRVDPSAIVVLEVFKKKTQATPKKVIDACKKRIKEYDAPS